MGVLFGGWMGAVIRFGLWRKGVSLRSPTQRMRLRFRGTEDEVFSALVRTICGLSDVGNLLVNEQSRTIRVARVHRIPGFSVYQATLEARAYSDGSSVVVELDHQPSGMPLVRLEVGLATEELERIALSMRGKLIDGNGWDLVEKTMLPPIVETLAQRAKERLLVQVAARSSVPGVWFVTTSNRRGAALRNWLFVEGVPSTVRVDVLHDSGLLGANEALSEGDFVLVPLRETEDAEASARAVVHALQTRAGHYRGVRATIEAHNEDEEERSESASLRGRL